MQRLPGWVTILESASAHKQGIDLAFRKPIEPDLPSPGFLTKLNNTISASSPIIASENEDMLRGQDITLEIINGTQ